MPAKNMQKLETLKSSLSSLNEKISLLLNKKRNIEKQIKEIEEREFMNIIRDNNCTVLSLSDDLALAKQIKESNLSKSDVLELLKDLGGQNEENAEEKGA